MTIRLRIDRILIEDAPPGLDRAALTRAIQAELTRLLSTSEAVPAAVAVPVRYGPDILEPGSTAAALGTRIAGAVHAALPHQPGRAAPAAGAGEPR